MKQAPVSVFIHSVSEALFLCRSTSPSLSKLLDMAAHAVYRGPSVVKEIFCGISIGLMAGFLWKMHHWNLQKRTREFYEMLDKGEISVVVEEDE